MTRSRSKLESKTGLDSDRGAKTSLQSRAGLVDGGKQREKKEDKRGLKKPLEGCRCKAFSFLYFHKPDSTIQDDPVSDGKGQGSGDMA